MTDPEKIAALQEQLAALIRNIESMLRTVGHEAKCQRCGVQVFNVPCGMGYDVAFELSAGEHVCGSGT